MLDDPECKDIYQRVSIVLDEKLEQLTDAREKLEKQLGQYTSMKASDHT